jgi:hypothetical protein
LHNVILRYDWTNLSWWLDWQQIASDLATSWNWTSLAVSQISIWNESQETNWWMNWNIQSVKIYNYALSTKEIQSLYMEWLKLLH